MKNINIEKCIKIAVCIGIPISLFWIGFANLGTYGIFFGVFSTSLMIILIALIQWLYSSL